jgi:hypothetical protein
MPTGDLKTLHAQCQITYYHFLFLGLCPLFSSICLARYTGSLNSKHQKVTAVSSAEAEIYATDECVHFLLELVKIFEFLGIKETFMLDTTTIFNDNQACVNCSHSGTTKGLRHIQMKENHIGENILSNFITIQHVEDRLNLADIFTKEMKNVGHFAELRDLIMCPRFHS